MKILRGCYAFEIQARASGSAGNALAVPGMDALRPDICGPRRHQCAVGEGAPFRVTAPLTVLGSTIISFSLASTSGGASAW